VFSRFISDYGMVFVLLGLCAWFSWVTMADQHPTGAAAGEQLARELRGKGGVLVVARDTPEDAQFVAALERSLERGQLIRAVKGQPADARRALEQYRAEIKAIACNQVTANWAVFDGSIPVLKPRSYRWPNFLKRENLLNIANQIAVIAIVAIGMTMVIITRGIDLSVGSLIALAAVAATLLIRDRGGAESATAAAMTLSSFGGIALCGFIGFLSGVLVTYFVVPAFIATLGMMLVASGLAFIVAKGQSIYQVPDAFIWLGRGAAFGIPNAVWLMAILYLLAHVLMTHTALGRYIYAVGGNPEAARFSGVPVNRVLLFVYTVCGALAGLGGVIMASQLKSGSPTYGLMYELFVIAAAVVGGTSLSGGQGKILGTLIGAFIIAVIQNGMNLTGVESYTQKVILGLVILGAVLVDILKKRGWEKYLRRAKT
jgi:ribose transport system permease protein